MTTPEPRGKMLPDAPGVVHYAPHGRYANGTFHCGATDGGYTDKPGNVTCEGCKKQSPGLWPKVPASPPLSDDERSELERLRAENADLRLRLLSAAGDDLCRLSQEEIKAYSSGAVKIPPKEEFIASCERFHAQVAKESGVLEGCLTLAQLIAENAKLDGQLAAIADAWKRIAGFAVCESCGPLKQYRVTIDYRTLEQAQDAYRAMAEIDAALAPQAEKPQ